MTHLKGFNQLASQQSFWNDAERQMYTDLMARVTLSTDILRFKLIKLQMTQVTWVLEVSLSLFLAAKFQKFYSENPEYEDSNVVLQCFSNNGIQTYNNVKELMPHPIAFIFDSGPAYCTFPYDFDIPGRFHS